MLSPKLIQASLPTHNQRWESVVHLLRLAIVTGDLAPGTHLVETELAQQLNVSRGPIRDALTRLESEGLVVNQPYRGKFVADITVQDISDIYALRLLLENYAISRILSRGVSEDEIARLRELRQQMIKAISQNRYEECADYDVMFHRELVTLAGSDRLLQMWNTLAGVSHAFIVVNMRNQADIVLGLARGHDTIIEALARRDAAAARAALEKHLGEAEQAILQARHTQPLEAAASPEL